MKCAKCQDEMIQAKNSWLCMNCGHLESVSPDSVPLVSKKRSSVKKVAQDIPVVEPKKKNDEPKAVTQSVMEVEKESAEIPTIAEATLSQTAPEIVDPPKALNVSGNDTIDPKSTDTTPQKSETEEKPDTSLPSVAPSAAELHPAQPVVVSPPNESTSPKNDISIPEDTKETSSQVNVTAPPKLTEETKADSIDPIKPTFSSKPSEPDVEVVKPVNIPSAEAPAKPVEISAPELAKSDPATKEEVAPNNTPIPSAVAPEVPAKTEPVPAPPIEVPAEPAPTASLPVAEIAPSSTPIKTVAPETHPAPVNIGLIIWIIVAIVSFIALVVFGYAFYKGIDLFAGLRK